VTGYLLDTNVVSEATKPQRHAGVMAFLQANQHGQMYLSVITLGELERGIGLLGDTHRGRELRAWFETRCKTDYAGHILPIDLAVVLEWGRLMTMPAARARQGIAIDMLIAATARVHDLTLVTRNVEDFTPFGVKIYDPWTVNSIA
jgi:toxin FitB